MSYDNLDIKAPFVAHLPESNCRIGISIGSQQPLFDLRFPNFTKLRYRLRSLIFEVSNLGGRTGGFSLFQKFQKLHNSGNTGGNPFTCVGFWLAPAAKQRGVTPANLQLWLILKFRDNLSIGGLGHPGEHLKRGIIWGNTGAADCMSLVACSCWQLLGA